MHFNGAYFWLVNCCFAVIAKITHIRLPFDLTLLTPRSRLGPRGAALFDRTGLESTVLLWNTRPASRAHEQKKAEASNIAVDAFYEESFGGGLEAY